MTAPARTRIALRCRSRRRGRRDSLTVTRWLAPGRHLAFTRPSTGLLAALAPPPRGIKMTATWHLLAASPGHASSQVTPLAVESASPNGIRALDHASCAGSKRAIIGRNGLLVEKCLVPASKSAQKWFPLK